MKWGTKVFTKTMERSNLTMSTTSNGETISSVPGMLAEVEEFYGNLYASYASKPPPDVSDPRASLTRHFTDILRDIDVDEIETTLTQFNNERAPEVDDITSELHKAGGNQSLKSSKGYSTRSYLTNGITPSHVFKLFSRVDTNRLASRFEAFQPPEQAGF